MLKNSQNQSYLKSINKFFKTNNNCYFVCVCMCVCVLYIKSVYDLVK